jgi:crotonobetainyl-CoA:carnitine CoA-transferase CaiB-like acyl-CoA transferase
MPGALDGVKVVELALWAAASAGGGIMADWGAEVIKVEDPDGGDPIPP